MLYFTIYTIYVGEEKNYPQEAKEVWTSRINGFIKKIKTIIIHTQLTHSICPVERGRGRDETHGSRDPHEAEGAKQDTIGEKRGTGD